MRKRKTNEEWINWFKKYEEDVFMNKKIKKREYVFDWARGIVEEVFIDNHCIYGSKDFIKFWSLRVR